MWKILQKKVFTISNTIRWLRKYQERKVSAHLRIEFTELGSNSICMIACECNLPKNNFRDTRQISTEGYKCEIEIRTLAHLILGFTNMHPEAIEDHKQYCYVKRRSPEPTNPPNSTSETEND